MGVSAHDLVERAKAESRAIELDGGSAYRARVAPIAAGEKVVASIRSATHKLIRKNYRDAIAVEMEGRGLLEAVHTNASVSGLIIRGISDLLDAKAQADAAGSQAVASENAADFAFRILARFLPGEQAASRRRPRSRILAWGGALAALAVLVLSLSGPHWLDALRPMPHAQAGAFTVAFCHFADDPAREMERNVADDLAGFAGIRVLSVPATPYPESLSDVTGALDSGRESARELVRRTGADVVLWGTVFKSGGRVVPKLPLTLALGPKPERYSLAEDTLRLPAVFWFGLSELLRLVVANSLSEAVSAPGRERESLASLVEREEKLLATANASIGWNKEANSDLHFLLGKAHLELGRLVSGLDETRRAIALLGEAADSCGNSNDGNCANIRTGFAFALTELAMRTGSDAKTASVGRNLLWTGSVFRDGTDYRLSVSQCGELGAATGTLNCVLAVRAWQREYANGPQALVCGSGWAGLGWAACRRYS